MLLKTNPQLPQNNSKYRFNTSNIDIDPEWDDFIARTPGGSFFQTSSFSRAYHELNWDVSRITLIDKDDIIAGVQILTRKIFHGKSIGRIINAPVFAESATKPIIDQMLSFLINYMKINQIVFLSMQPGLPNVDVESKAKSLGMYIGPDFYDPSNEVMIDLQDDIETIFLRIKHDKRRDIRRSQRRGVSFREGERGDLPIFYRLHSLSGNRGGYNPYTLPFYERLWDGFSPKNAFHLFFTDFEGKPLAGLLTVVDNDTLYAYHIGWCGEYSQLYPNDALYWGAIVWAKEHHYKYFSMSGVDVLSAQAYQAGKPIPESRIDTYSRFKLHFGGKIYFHSATYYFSNNPLFNWASQRYFDTPIVSKSINIAYNVYKKIRLFYPSRSNNVRENDLLSTTPGNDKPGLSIPARVRSSRRSIPR